MAHIPQSMHKYRVQEQRTSRGVLRWDPQNPLLGITGKNGVRFPKRVPVTWNPNEGPKWTPRPFCRFCKFIIVHPFPYSACFVCSKKLQFEKAALLRDQISFLKGEGEGKVHSSAIGGMNRRGKPKRKSKPYGKKK